MLFLVSAGFGAYMLQLVKILSAAQSILPFRSCYSCESPFTYKNLVQAGGAPSHNTDTEKKNVTGSFTAASWRAFSFAFIAVNQISFFSFPSDYGEAIWIERLKASSNLIGDLQWWSQRTPEHSQFQFCTKHDKIC